MGFQAFRVLGTFVVCLFLTGCFLDSRMSCANGLCTSDIRQFRDMFSLVGSASSTNARGIYSMMEVGTDLYALAYVLGWGGMNPYQQGPE